MMHVLKKIAASAAKVVRENVEEGMFEYVGRGASGDKTMAIDVLVENYIIAQINEADLPLNILSEEAGMIDRNHEATLVLDPLDGTYNCSRGIPFYAISMAVVRGCMKNTLAALVYNFIEEQMYTAMKGKGAYLNDTRICVRKPVPEDAVFSINLGKDVPAAILPLCSVPKRVRALGSAALEICYVADGRLDLYLNVRSDGGLRIVDVAAAVAILREAGGEAYDEALNPLDFPLKPAYRKSVIAVSDGTWLRYVKEVV